MELQQFVCLSAMFVAGGCWVLVIRLAAINWSPASRAGRAVKADGARVSDLTLGVVLAAIGAILVAIALMGTIGPWGPRQPEVMRVRVVDLSAPPADIERASPAVETAGGPLSAAPARAQPRSSSSVRHHRANWASARREGQSHELRNPS